MGLLNLLTKNWGFLSNKGENSLDIQARFHLPPSKLGYLSCFLHPQEFISVYYTTGVDIQI